MSLDLSSVATKLLGDLASNADGYIQLVRESGGSTDNVTGNYTEGTSSTVDLIGAVTTITAKTADNTRTLIGDVMVTADNTTEPLMTDKLLIGGVEYKIVPPIVTINHAGIVQVYKIQGRK